MLQLFVDIARLQARPQDLPASDGLLVASVIAYALGSVLAIGPIYPLSLGAAGVGLDLLLMFSLIHAALHFTGRVARFRQTLTAVCGTGALFALLSWPLYQIIAERADSSPWAAGAALLLLGLYAWILVVIGHILRHAFDIRLGSAVLVALAYVILTATLGQYLLPLPETG